jgi:hypothetical protein
MTFLRQKWGSSYIFSSALHLLSCGYENLLATYLHPEGVALPDMLSEEYWVNGRS